jgi:aryl-alcohol dehydrogenase-like predicted oxidoreductase
VEQHSLLDDIEIGIGCWAWGDKRVWGYGRGYGDSDLRGAFDAAIASGVRLFDTAEAYGFGKSERLLGRFMAETGKRVAIATKFFPFPWRLAKAQLPRALRRSLRRLGIAHADLYQMHWPVPPRSVAAWMEPLASAVSEGLVKEVGVSNYNVAQMRTAFDRLAARGVRLASNQVEYSLLRRDVEFNGVLDACREMKVRLIAYSPLAMGMLSGKYTPDAPPPGLRGLRYRRPLLSNLKPLIGLLDDIGRAHGGKTRNQVALNWLICKGALPIPGAKSAAHARDNAAAAGWRLTAADVAALDEASLRFTRRYGGPDSRSS